MSLRIRKQRIPGLIPRKAIATLGVVAFAVRSQGVVSDEAAQVITDGSTRDVMALKSKRVPYLGRGQRVVGRSYDPPHVLALNPALTSRLCWVARARVAPRSRRKGFLNLARFEFQTPDLLADVLVHRDKDILWLLGEKVRDTLG